MRGLVWRSGCDNAAEPDPHFFTVIKQNGALLAKGRMLGIQFDTLLKMTFT